MMNTDSRAHDSKNVEDKHHHQEPLQAHGGAAPRSLLRKIAEYLHPGPDSKEELLEALQDAEDRDVISEQSLDMLQGVIKLAEMTAGDVMVAAPRMELLDIDAPFEALLHAVIDTAHSRFPVYEGERDNIIGILHAKDLLKRQRAPDVHLRTLLRPAVFVPESKGLNELLTEFKGKRHHLAVVIDEFGKVAGLITIEDILEEIVGEIEDEFDDDGKEGQNNIVNLPQDGWYRISGGAALLDIQDRLGVEFSEDQLEQFETLGGLVAHRIGRVPQKSETHEVAQLMLTVLNAKSGAVRWFKACLKSQQA